MKRNFKTTLILCALLLGLSLLLPGKTVLAAESAKSQTQLRVDTKNQTVTVDFKDFCSEGYIYQVKDESNQLVLPKQEVSPAEEDIHHLTISTASLPQGYYKLIITGKTGAASSSAAESIRYHFYTYDSIGTITYTNSTRTLNWTDSMTATTRYRIRYYKSAADLSVPGSYLYEQYNLAANKSREIPSGLNGATYYAAITPYITKDTLNYWGETATLALTPIKAPTNVSASPGYKSAVISWSSVEGASAYVVKNLTTKETAVVASSKTKFTWTGLQEESTYKFCVYSRLNKSTSARSDVVRVSIPKAITQKVTGLQIYSYNGTIYLTWDKVDGADGYKIYYKKSSDTAYTVLGSTTNQTYKVNLSLNNQCTFLVKPYTLISGKKIDQAAGIATVKGNPATLLRDTETIRTIGYLSRTRRRTKLYNSYTSKTAAKTIGSGVKLEQLEPKNKTYNRCKVLYQNQVYYCSYSNIYSYGYNYTSNHYSTAVKERFVKNYSSSTGYLIWISQYTMQVSIFKGSKGNWDMIRTFTCAIGKHTTRTVTGTFKVQRKERGWYNSSTYESYVTRFYGGYAFHSRIHYYGGGYSDATIGRPASHGCIRLYDQDAKYIYKNIPKGTTVISY